jgi:hypothetical protein
MTYPSLSPDIVRQISFHMADSPFVLFIWKGVRTMTSGGISQCSPWKIQVTRAK